MKRSDQLALAAIHDEIDACEMCRGRVGEGFEKIRGLDRGSGGRIIVVGQGPGSSERTKRRAFAGASGRRLDTWLTLAGANPQAPREHVYATSLVKCVAPNSARELKAMVANCAHFLDKQLRTLRPELIITLGEYAYRAFAEDGERFGDAVCKAFRSGRNLLLDRAIGDVLVMPWPHPSPSNNGLVARLEKEERLQASFAAMRPILESLHLPRGDSNS